MRYRPERVGDALSGKGNVASFYDVGGEGAPLAPNLVPKDLAGARRLLSSTTTTLGMFRRDLRIPRRL